MTPTMQTKLYTKDGGHNGNCLAACFASLLDLPLWMVPPFDQMFGRSDWHSRIDEWFERMHGMDYVYTKGHEFEKLPEFYIGCGLSARGVQHATIWQRGHMVHDPHYSGAGIASVDYTYHLEPLK